MKHSHNGPRSCAPVHNDAMDPFSVLTFSLVYPLMLARRVAVVQGHLRTAVRDDGLAQSLGQTTLP